MLWGCVVPTVPAQQLSTAARLSLWLSRAAAACAGLPELDTPKCHCYICVHLSHCVQSTQWRKKSSSEHMVAFWKRMSACPILQRGFYFLACLEKQAGLLSSGVFSKPLAVTFSLLMLLGQRCEGVGGASLTGTSGASSLCCFLGSVCFTSEQHWCLSQRLLQAGALSWSCIPCSSRALEMLLSYERKSYHWCSFKKKKVWLAGKKLEFCSFR